MKKLTILLFTVLLSTSLCCFAQDAENPLAQSKSIKEELKSRSPEDSVLVFGIFRETSCAIFVQNDPKMPHDTVTTRFLPLQDYFILRPVIPGGSYRLIYIESAGIEPYVSMDGSFLDFKAPKKPGLYYFGAYDPYYSVKEDSPTDHLYFSNGQTIDDKTKELKALKAVMTYAKGTAWEPIVQARIDQLRKENIPEEN